MLRVAEQAFRSDTGRQRTANEDSYYASEPLYAVADGMGGARAGEVASRIAVEALDPTDRAGAAPETFLRGIVEVANERIHELAERDTSRSGMGTTLTAAMIEGDEVSIAHVGDSRAYLWRDGKLRLLTSDHSLVEELRKQGRLTEEQAEDHPQRSIITRALGPDAEVEVDTSTHSARQGDVYLLCSDGLTTMVKDDRVAEILAADDELDAVAARLVDEANAAGGRDNITVVAFRLADAAEVEAEEGATLVGPTAEEAGLSGAAVRERAAAAPTPAAGRRPGAPPARPRRRSRIAIKVLAGLLVLAVVAAGAVLGARQIYFLGTDEGGRLALYRGLPYELPLDVDLYSEVVSTPTQVDALPEERLDEATGHDLRFRDDAVDLLADLEESATTTTSPTSPGGQGKPGSGASGGDTASGRRREAGLTGRKSQATAGGRDGTRGGNGSR